MLPAYEHDRAKCWYRMSLHPVCWQVHGLMNIWNRTELMISLQYRVFSIIGKETHHYLFHLCASFWTSTTHPLYPYCCLSFPLPQFCSLSSLTALIDLDYSKEDDLHSVTVEKRKNAQSIKLKLGVKSLVGSSWAPSFPVIAC